MPKSKKSDSKSDGRSPSWKIFARVDPSLEAKVEEYTARQKFPPTLSKVIERALNLLLEQDSADDTD